MDINPVDDLPDPGENELLAWVYDHVHTVYAEHWSNMYDRCPENSISTAILLTYRALQIALENRLETVDDEDDDDDITA